MAELSTRFNLHPNMITTWKRDFIERSSAIFETDRPVSNFDDERERLFAKIGRLEMELDWLKKMGLMAIYPKRNLSKLGLAKYIRPYLLRGLLIDRPNQVWAIDITYIPVAKGFLYLTAAMDVYSRYVVAWDLHNSLDATHVLNVLKKAVSTHGHPEIINSDQGSQFTCSLWIEYLERSDIKISMDGKGRAIDNVFIERFWRTIKYDYVYLHPMNDGRAMYTGLRWYIDHYNHRAHQGIGRISPIELYKKSA